MARRRNRTVEQRFEQIVAVQERERSRIARDIHDQLGQQMTALRLTLESLRDMAWPVPPVAEQAARAEQLARELDRAIDFLALDLRPGALAHLGLAPALDQLVTDWAKRFKIPAEFGDAGMTGLKIAKTVEVNLYRMAQEALHNVYKHSGATHASVSLERRGDRLQLVIEDNGGGFDASIAHNPGNGRLGLIGMRERAELIDAELVIDSSGSGTTIFVRVPLARALRHE